MFIISRYFAKKEFHKSLFMLYDSLHLVFTFISAAFKIKVMNFSQWRQLLK